MTGEQRGVAASNLPSGVLTVMFTDLEESTLRWEIDAAEMRRVMNVHDDVLDRAVRAHNGVVFKSTGDGIGAVFASPSRAVDAAVMIQRQLQAVPWRRDRPRVRIGLHLGDISPTRGDYYGGDVNRAARIMDVANGDQIAISDPMTEFVAPDRRTACGEHELRGIGVESIHLVHDAGLIDDQRPLRALAVGRARKLPSVVSLSVGRQREIAEIAELVRSKRLVTVVGVGGVGKTHVGLAVARLLEPDFADGAVFVDLGSIRDADDVAPTIATAVGARLQPGLDLLASIGHYVEGRELLVLLDNCEHVINAVAHVISQFLESHGVAVLSTSRSSFKSAHEQVYPLAPLAGADGIELFADRARNRDPRLVPPADEHAMVARICSAVGGIPLGIELAAAWVRVLSLEDLADRLERSLDVALPTGSPRTRSVADPRQETLRSTIEWSYLQLTELEALLFDRVSVFMGGFSIEAAEAVCADAHIAVEDIAPLLMALVDASMISVEYVGSDHRFSLLRPLQLFGADNMVTRGGFDEISRRHGEFYSKSVTQAGDRLVGERESEVWAFFEVEWSNIRETFSRLRAAGESNAAAKLLLDLGWYSTLALRSEAFSWADDLLSSDEPDVLEATSSVLGLRALHKYFIVDPDSRSDAELGLAMDATDPEGFCRIALGAVWVNNQQAAHESALWTNEWIASLTPTSPTMSRLWAHGMRAFHLCVHDLDSPELLAHVSAIEDIAAETMSTSAHVLAHWVRGMHLVSATSGTGQPADIGNGLDEWRTGRELARSLSDVHLLDYLITSIELHMTAADGALEDAIRLSRDALRRARRHHYVAGTSHLFGVTAIVLARTGRADLGQRLLPVMIANGHPPRRNAIDAITPSGVADLVEQAGILSIHDAAQLADAALSEVLRNRA